MIRPKRLFLDGHRPFQKLLLLRSKRALPVKRGRFGCSFGRWCQLEQPAMDDDGFGGPIAIEQEGSKGFQVAVSA